MGKIERKINFLTNVAESADNHYFDRVWIILKTSADNLSQIILTIKVGRRKEKKKKKKTQVIEKKRSNIRMSKFLTNNKIKF